MITLIIVNAQSDFLTGTMCFKGGKNILDHIKKYIKVHKDEIDKILFTGDWHPYNHCSFKKYGGEFPHHCIQYTPGSCIEPKLLKYVQSYDIPYEVCLKGELQDFDPEGHFEEIEFVKDSSLGDLYYFDSLYSAHANTKFIICGFADCLIPTVKNLITGGITPTIFMSGVASRDGGKDISSFAKSNNLEYEKL